MRADYEPHIQISGRGDCDEDTHMPIIDICICCNECQLRATIPSYQDLPSDDEVVETDKGNVDLVMMSVIRLVLNIISVPRMI